MLVASNKISTITCLPIFVLTISFILHGSCVPLLMHLQPRQLPSPGGSFFAAMFLSVMRIPVIKILLFLIQVLVALFYPLICFQLITLRIQPIALICYLIEFEDCFSQMCCQPILQCLKCFLVIFFLHDSCVYYCPFLF